MKVREHGQRRRQAHPAVEVATVTPEANTEAHERDEPEDGEKCRGEPHVRALDQLAGRCDLGPRHPHAEGAGNEEPENTDADCRERAATRRQSPVRVRGDGDERCSEQSGAEVLPGRSRVERAALQY